MGIRYKAGGAMTTSEMESPGRQVEKRRERREGGAFGVKVMLCSPVLGSRVASLRILTSARLASRDTGFILKLPPTKNWRVMVVRG